MPLAFGHGWLTGRSHGVKLGAAGMFDQLFDKGVPVRGKNTRMIEVSLDQDENVE